MQEQTLDLVINCILHNICDLKCRFCYNRLYNSAIINVNYIKSLPEKIIQFANFKIQQYNSRKFQINLFGGELFQDNFDNSIFDLYKELINELFILVDRKLSGIEFNISIITNGMFQNYDRVQKFLDYVIKNFNGLTLSMSYDPIGRFSNDHQKEIWLNTFNYFKDIISGISTTLTKPNIYAYINGDKLFESLGNRVQVFGVYYLRPFQHLDYLPSDDDIYNFYKWGLDNSKFNINDIDLVLKKYLKYNILRFCHCQNNYYFIEEVGKSNNIQIIDCIQLVGLENYIQHQRLIELSMSRRGCFECDQYNNCQTICWASILFDEYKITTCPLKRAHKYLDNNPHIVEKYKT